MFNLKNNKSKSLFLILGGIFLVSGYYIRKYEAFIPYRYINKETKNKFISQAKKKNFFFKDITSELGINFKYNPPKISPIAYFRVDSLVQGPGSASIDINQDGHMDIFIVSSRPEEPSHLYISEGGTGYSEQAQKYGLENISNKDFFGLVPVFFDSDNDGDMDLYISGIGCARFYVNQNNKFFDQSKESQLGDCKSSQAAIFFDYDGDNLLDLYVLRYWGENTDLIHKNDPYVYINNLHNADNGGRNTLYKNMGNNTFKDVTSQDGGGDEHWSYDASYADLDNDGKFEIYISNDYGPDTVYRIVNKKLVNISDIFSVPDRRYGMNVSLLDLGENKPGVYISNQYVGHGYALYGNFFWQMRKRENIYDQAKEYNLYDCGMAWGAAHGDFNLDGQEDLYIANGYAAPRKHYIESENNFRKKTYTFPTLNQDNTFYYEWFLTALPGRITQDIRSWKKLIFRGSRYDQQDCLFLNQNNEFFHNVSNELSDVKIWNGKSVITTDPDNDGILDLFVTTNNGPVHYFKNQLSKKNKNWIGFSISSNKTNRQAIGARVQISQNNKNYFRWNTGGRSGLLSTSDPRLHFGLGSTEDVELKIKWPDGTIKKYGKFKPGKYYDISH